MRQTPFARLLSYIFGNPSIGGVLEPGTVNDRSAPIPTSRPALTRGRHQMSQKSRSNRRKAGRKARRA